MEHLRSSEARFLENIMVNLCRCKSSSFPQCISVEFDLLGLKQPIVPGLVKSCTCAQNLQATFFGLIWEALVAPLHSTSILRRDLSALLMCTWTRASWVATKIAFYLLSALLFVWSVHFVILTQTQICLHS